MFDWKTQKQLHKDLIKSSSKKQYDDINYNTYKKLNEQAYKNKSFDIDENLKLITENEFNKLYQDRRNGNIYQSISGSRNMKDFLNDGLQYLGFNNNLLQKQRLKSSQDLLDKINNIKTNKIFLTGHSLGGNITNQLIKNNENNIDKVINFNPFIPNTEAINDDYRILNIRNKNDFASKFIKDRKNVLNLDNDSNLFKSHLLKNIEI